MTFDSTDDPELAAPSASAEDDGSVPSSDSPPTAGGAVSDWNGERESLAKETWWAELPEQVRSTVERGIQTKYTNFHRGADRARMEATTALAAERDRAAALEAALENAKKDQDFFAKLLEEDDAVRPLSEKLTSLERALGERESALTEAQNRLAEFEARTRDIEIERLQDKHRSKYQDIYDDFVEDPNWQPGSPTPPNPTGAYTDFVRLVQAGWSEERAASVVRADMGLRRPAAPAPTRVPVEPPKSVALASDGAGPSVAKATRELNESFEDVMRRKRAELEASGE